MIQLNLLSNIFSFLSTGLIFFILAMVISGWWVSSQVVEVIQGEAEISVYYEDDISNIGISQLIHDIETVEGVREVRLVDENEAYSRMVEILGKEARVLEFFDENPFNSFIEVNIDLEEISTILDKLDRISGIQHVRDNREVLDRLRNIAEVLRFIGYLVIAAVGVSTLVIISHIIRQGIYNNREQINTLRLLGAPEGFIAFPFVLEGLLLTLGGGILASAMTAFVLEEVYAQLVGPLPFIPLPPREALISNITMLITVLSGMLGIIGSMMGLSSAKSN